MVPPEPDASAGTPASAPHRARTRRPRLVAVGQIVAGVVLVGVAAWCYLTGRRVDAWPAYVAGTTHTDITRWSGPWIGGAVAAFIVALPLIAAGAARLVRMWYLQRQFARVQPAGTWAPAAPPELR